MFTFKQQNYTPVKLKKKKQDSWVMMTAQV